MAQAESLAITAHEYMTMPDGPPYYQLIEGELLMSPSPNWRHQDIAGRIYAKILNYLEDQNIGYVFISPLDVILTELNVVQPDVLFVSSERKSIVGERCIEGAPDFVVEILSDSTAHLDKGQKRKIYARTGVKELWIVNSELKEIAVYDLKKSVGTPQATYGANERLKSKIFPGLEFSCAAIFKAI